MDFKLVTSNLLYEIKENFDVDDLGNILRFVSSGVLIKPKEGSVEISLSYKLDNLSIIFYEYIIENNNTVVDDISPLFNAENKIIDINPQLTSDDWREIDISIKQDATDKGLLKEERDWI